MKTFGKTMLTLLYMLIAGCELYCVRRYLIEADKLWENN